MNEQLQSKNQQSQNFNGQTHIEINSISSSNQKNSVLSKLNSSDQLQQNNSDQLNQNNDKKIIRQKSDRSREQSKETTNYDQNVDQYKYQHKLNIIRGKDHRKIIFLRTQNEENSNKNRLNNLTIQTVKPEGGSTSLKHKLKLPDKDQKKINKQYVEEETGRIQYKADMTLRYNQIDKYRQKGDSEYMIHFYLKGLNLYEQTNKFLHDVFQALCRIGECRHLQIINWEKDEQKCDLAVGYRYDRDAIDILKKKQKIILKDYYGGGQQVIKPYVSRAFESSLDEDLRENMYAYSSFSKKEKNNKLNMGILNKQDYIENNEDNMKNKKNLESLEKCGEIQKNNSNFSESIKLGNNSLEVGQNDQNNEVENKEKFKNFDSRMDLMQQNIENEENKKQDCQEEHLQKEELNNFKNQGLNLVISENISSINSISTNNKGQKYDINDQKEDNCGLNQQILNNALSNKEQGVSDDNEKYIKKQYDNSSYKDKKQKSRSRSRSRSQLKGKEMKNDKKRLKSPSQNKQKSLETKTQIYEEPYSSQIAPQIQNNFISDQLINLEQDLFVQSEPLQQPNQQLAFIDPDQVCNVLGLPIEYGENEIYEAIYKLNSLIRQQLFDKPQEELQMYLIDMPLSIKLLRNDEIEYIQLTFPNSKSTESLIWNSLLIGQFQHPLLVLPMIPQKSIKDLLYYHEVKVQVSCESINAGIVYNVFSRYGKIVDILSLIAEKSFIVIFQQQWTKLLSGPQIIELHIDQNQFQLEIGFIQNFVYPLVRVGLSDTVTYKFQYKPQLSPNQKQ